MGSLCFEGFMQKIKMVRQTVAAQKVVRVGDVVEVSDSEAKLLFTYKKAVPFREAEMKNEVLSQEVAPEEVTTPTKKGKKKDV